MKNQSVAVEPVFSTQDACHPIGPAKVYSSIVDVVFAINEKGIFPFVSPSCIDLFGYTQKEMTGASFLNFIHTDDIEKTVQAIAERTPYCKTFNFENRYIKKDGSIIPLIWSGRWDAIDQLFYCVARDGSEKSAVEQRLRKAQQIACVANFEFDVVNNSYTYTSDTLFDIFGLDRNKHPRFTPELFWSLVHPEDADLVRESVLQTEHLYSSTLEYRIIRPDGVVVYINRIREVIRDLNGKPVNIIGTLQDITDRKISELALKQSEVKFRSLVQNGNDLLGIIDLHGTYLFVGENVKEHLGISAEELVGRNAFDFIHPDDAAWVGAQLQEITSHHTLTTDPFRFRNGNGEWRWVETTVSNHVENPAIGGLVVNSRDVTEKKQKDDENRLFQQKVEEQNQMMFEVLEQTRDGFLTITLEGKLIYWNAAAERITGRPREAMLGESIWNLYPGIEKTPYYRAYERLVITHEPIQEVVFSPFQKRWVEIRAYRTQKGISVFFRDLTEKITAEEEMRKLSLIARETTNSVILQDSERKVLWVNDAFVQLTGYNLDECTGKHITEICDGPDTNFETLRYVEERVSRNEPFRIETLNYKKNRETYWSDVSCQPVLDDNGKVVQYFSIATDITERKKLEKKLEQEQRKRQMQIAAATLKAQEKERSVVSQELHDNVNQVLTTVKLYTEMCRDGIGNPKEIMGKSVIFLQESINEIRCLSKRLSAPSLGKIKLAESIKELVNAVAVTNKFKVQLDTTSIDQLEVGQEIHLAVYRILQEHLTNILKHAAANSVEIMLDCVMGFVHLRVKDDGVGFDQKKKTSGIGITNMITRAEILQGTITIESVPGGGCELSVNIPL